MSTRPSGLMCGSSSSALVLKGRLTGPGLGSAVRAEGNRSAARKRRTPRRGSDVVMGRIRRVRAGNSKQTDAAGGGCDGGADSDRIAFSLPGRAGEREAATPPRNALTSLAYDRVGPVNVRRRNSGR